MGLSTLRNTFVLWDSETGKNFTNFIVWKDTRSSELCSAWNHSFQVKALRFGGKFLYFLTRKKRFLAASMLKFTTGMVVMRLLWALKHTPGIQKRLSEGKVLYGTVDTWIIWKLTKGSVHSTEPSNACVSGFYDPFEMTWGKWAIRLFGIPESILPQVRDTNHNFGDSDPEFFGSPIPIRYFSCSTSTLNHFKSLHTSINRSVIGDQQAAMFGECCFKVGDVKCTLGTGSFININTGHTPHASFKGLYPVVGWKMVDKEPVYLAEGKLNAHIYIFCF